MKKRARKDEQKRLNLVLGIGAYRRIEVLRTETDKSSVTDVIRQSLALYEFLVTRRKQGAKIFIEDEHGRQELVIL
jgi:hypothetical protein